MLPVTFFHPDHFFPDQYCSPFKPIQSTTCPASPNLIPGLDFWQEDPEGTESPSPLAEGPNNPRQLYQQYCDKWEFNRGDL